ncbi:MAG: non-ribosomal peptide synthetase, partial [Gammaproteobacteria bacterium]|nr:non-ribosomal peptide synthetase [Gammaproteobacteria bacterium]
LDVRDDFFELGGHSLLITRTAARIFGTFGIELPFRTLLEKRTVAELAEAVDELCRGPSAAVTPLRPRPRGDQAPLSFAQQRLWFFEQLEPGSAAYNIPGAAALDGELDVTALERTFTEIVRRHEILRTHYPDSGGRPVAVVSAPRDARLPVADLRGLAAPGRDVAARRIVNDQVRRPFDLDEGPLLRAGLLRLDDRRHVLWLCMHHIVADAWSIDLLVHEVGTLYAHFTRGGSVTASAADAALPLEPLPLQYADFAAWQHESLTPAVVERLSSYWRRQLAGAPQRLELRAARPRPASGLPRGAKRALALPESVAAGAAALGRREGATLFMTLLAAFEVLLAHHTDSTDIVVGTNTANRTHPQTAGLIGFFVNQLVLRTSLRGDPSFRELLARVRETALSAYAHQDLPFEQLVADLRPERAGASSPLFQIKFELREAAERVLRLPSLKLTPLPTDHVVVRHDLHMIVSRDRAGMSAALLYDARLFDEGTVAGLLEDYAVLSEAAVTQPESTVTDLCERLAQRRSGQRIAAARSLQALSSQMLSRQMPSSRTPSSETPRSRRRRAAGA